MHQTYTIKNTITISPTGEGYEQYEALADAAITPGHVVELLSTGKIQKQNTTSIDVERAVAIEDYLQGNDIADAYSAGNVAMYRIFTRGALVALILADGQNVAIGDKLESAGAGEVKKYSAGVKLFVAMNAVNASDSKTTPVASRRIVGRVI